MVSHSSPLTPVPDPLRSFDDPPGTFGSPPITVDEIISTVATGDEFSRTTDTLVDDAKAIIECLEEGTLVKSSISVKKLFNAMLDNAISEASRRYTACAIIAARSDDERKIVAEAWLDHLLYPMKAAGHKTTMVPSQEQTPSTHDTVATLVESAKRNQKALKELLRRREGGRCAVTGAPMMGTEGGGFNAPLRAAHILPYSLNNLNETMASLHDAAKTMDMLKSWCSVDLQNLVGDGINSPANSILIDLNSYEFFGNFYWWFEPTHDANTYTICSRLSLDYSGKTVRFQDHSNNNISTPHPHYLAIHTAFARVLHMSGAGEYFDKIWDEAEDTGVLSADGQSDIGTLLSSIYLRPKTQCS